MKKLIIDGDMFDSVDSFYEYILSLFSERKEYFGKNLDALFDILSESQYESVTLLHYQKIRFELGDEFFVSLQEIIFDLDVEGDIVFCA